MTGYSGRRLTEKLGLTSGMRAAFLNEPEGYDKTLGVLPDNMTMDTSLKPGVYDFIQFFTARRQELATKLPGIISHLKPDGMLWISWPKKSSDVPTDVTEQTLRDMGLPLGIVDIKVCAIDDTWSGLKFVIRKEIR